MANQLNLNTLSLEELKAKAEALPEFVDTTDATASQDHIVDGKTAYVNGTKITGANPYEKATTDAQVAEIGELIAELEAALDGKSVSGGGLNVETCTVTIRKETVAGGLYLYSYCTFSDSLKFEHYFEFTKDSPQLPGLVMWDEAGDYVIENVVVGSIINLGGRGGLISWSSSNNNFDPIRWGATQQDLVLRVYGDVILYFRDDD